MNQFKNKSGWVLLCSVICFLGAQTTFANKKPVGKSKGETENTIVEIFDSGTDMPEAIAINKEVAARKPASGNGPYSDSSISKEAQGVRDVFMAASKNHDQLENVLNEAFHKMNKGEYKELDTKYFLAQAFLLKPYRGIVWKLRPIFEAEKTKFGQAGSVTALRAIAKAVRLNLDGPEWVGRFDFLTAPSAHDSPTTQFHEMYDFQVYLETEVLSNLRNSSKIIQGVFKEMKERVVFDRRAFFGPESFKDNIDRFESHGHAEVAAVLADIEQSIYMLHVFCAFNQSQMIEATESFARVAGFNKVFLPGDELGVSSHTVVNEINRYNRLLTLRASQAPVPKSLKGYLEHFKGDKDNTGKIHMAMAYRSLATATKLSRTQIWPALSANGSFYTPTQALFNAQGLKAYERETEKSLVQAQAIVDGEKDGWTSVSSVITGDVAKVNLRDFFLRPPVNKNTGYFDYKLLLPTQFMGGNAEFSRTVDYVDEKGNSVRRDISWRNYYHGRPTAYNNDTWSRYIQCTGDSAGKPACVSDAMRTLQQGFGGALMSMPMALLVQ